MPLSKPWESRLGQFGDAEGRDGVTGSEGLE